MMYRVYLLLFVCCLLYRQAGAQALFTKHFTVDNGLPSNEIYNITEDSTGYLLIATDRGVVRYDGYSFEHILLSKEATVTPVYDIYESASGNIYFPGLKGQLYIYRHNVLSVYPNSKSLASRDSNAGLMIADAIAETTDGLEVKFNDNTSAYTLLTKNGQLQQQQDLPGIHFNLITGFCYKTFNDNINLRNTVQPLHITWQDGSKTLDSVRLSWNNGYLRKPYYVDLNGTAVFCAGRQLLFYRNKKCIARHLLNKNPLCLSAMPGGELMIGFESGGVEVYHLDGQQFSGPHQTYLSPLSVSHIHVDAQGGYWFATLDDGLYYSYPSKAIYWNNDSRIMFVEQQNDTCYIGHQNGDITLYNKGVLTGRLIVPVVPGEQLLNCTFDLHGKLIALTSRGYYLRINNQWNFKQGSDKLMLVINDSTAYGAGLVNAALHQYSFNTKQEAKQIALPKRIISLAKDKHDDLWLGTMEGLYHYGASGISFTGAKNAALQDRIVSLAVLPNRWVAVATLSNGLVLYNNDSVRILNTSNGLATPIINSMQLAGNSIWLGTNKGLTEVMFDNSKFMTRHYGSKYGLPTLDIHAFSIGGNWLYMKWINSLVAIRLDLLKASGKSADMFLSTISVNGKRIKNGTTLRHAENNIVFAFNHINFSDGPLQLYRYKLNGFEDKWHYTNDREAEYTNLGHGEYTFMVQVANSVGMFDTKSATASIIIKPAFWQQWWFFTLAGLMVVGLLWLAFRMRLRVINRRNELLLDLADSQQKALVQLINPHFLFNILNTAQSFILHDDKFRAVSLISRIARLLRLSLEVGKEQYVLLEQEIELLEKYLELEETRVPGKFTYSIEVEKSVSPPKLKIPGMLIQPFVENAIKHGMMHLKTHAGLIKVDFKMKDDLLLCTVTDNGVGRTQSAFINNAGSSANKSLGMDITNKRLQLIHRVQKSFYFFEVEDHHNLAGEPPGTTIIFSLPYIPEP